MRALCESFGTSRALAYRYIRRYLDHPSLINVDSGHRTPMTVLAIGAMGEIDCEERTSSILESGAA